MLKANCVTLFDFSEKCKCPKIIHANWWMSHSTLRTILGEIPRDRSRYYSEKLLNNAMEIAQVVTGSLRSLIPRGKKHW